MNFLISETLYKDLKPTCNRSFIFCGENCINMVFIRYHPLRFQYNTFRNLPSSDHVCQLAFRARCIHKISSFANIATATLWSLWCTCTKSLLVLLEGTDPICRQSNHVYASSCVFKMFNKIGKPAACEIQSIIHFLNARNIKPADIHHQLCEGEHAMSDSMVRRWVRHFNEGCENVHDDPRCGRPSVVNEDLVCIV
jgi:hypothetical protein